MKRDRFKNVTIIILIGIILVGLGYYWFSQDRTVEEKIVATVDGKQITEEELKEELLNVYGKEMLEDMINRKAIKLAADKYGIKADKNAIDRQYANLIQGYGSEAEFIDYLNEQMGWTKDQLVEYIEYNILWEEIATRDVQITDDQLQDYYQRNQANYSVPDRFHLEQIVVATEEEADQVIEELNNGSDFNTLAKERSMDIYSIGTGGDIGFVSADDTSVDFGIIEKAQNMQKNEIAKVQTLEGYAVIRLLETKEAVQYSFEEVKDQVRREMALNQISSLPEVLEQLKLEMNVEILDNRLK